MMDDNDELWRRFLFIPMESTESLTMDFRVCGGWRCLSFSFLFLIGIVFVCCCFDLLSFKMMRARSLISDGGQMVWHVAVAIVRGYCSTLRLGC